MVHYNYTKEIGGSSVAVTPVGFDTVSLAIQDVYPGFDLETIRKADLELQSTGKKQFRMARILTDNVWHKQDAISEISPETGLIHGTGSVISINFMYDGWPAKLDHAKKILRIDRNTALKQKDLQVLHYLVQGLPRGLIAQKMFVTIKAVEKRLTKIKDLLGDARTAQGDPCGGCQNCTLQGHLMHFSLIPFLLAELDWFNIQPYFKIRAA